MFAVIVDVGLEYSMAVALCQHVDVVALQAGMKRIDKQVLKCLPHPISEIGGVRVERVSFTAYPPHPK